MNDERPEDRSVERDSQLSAMFDGELASAECELLARRLTRDDGLRTQWSRYALIGAALRAERGVKLNDNVSRRVQAVISQEATYGDSSSTEVAAGSTRSNSAAAAKPSLRRMRFARPAAGASIAAGVAAVSILWLRTQGPDPALVADAAPPSESIVLTPEPVDTQLAMAATQPQAEPVSNGEPERYSTPAPSSQTSIAPPARFANYVVAHSEYSGPLARRMALLGIVGSDGQADQGDDDAPADVPADGTTPAAAAPGAATNAH
jgi:negative regulator of sigma E activity